MSKAFAKQQEVLDESIDQRLWAFFCEPGTGKTFMAITTAERWFREQGVTAVVVVCPKTLIFGTWVKVELPKHSTVPYLAWGWRSSFTKEMKADVIRKTKDRDKLLYIVVNHDALKSTKFQKVYNFVKLHRRVGWVYDESTALKHRRSDRTDLSTQLARGAAWKRIMTGTPFTESPMDVYAQTEFLEEGILGFGNYYGMKTRYCVLQKKLYGNRSFEVIKGYRDLDDLYRRLRRFSSFLKLEDCVDMPEQVYSRVAVEMTPDQRRHYAEMKAFALTYVEDHEVTAVNALSMLRKLHQIAVGQMKVGEDEYVTIENNRIDVLRDMLDDAGHRTVIWSVYRNSTQDILAALGDRVVGLSTRFSAERRADVVADWKRGSHQGIVLSQASAAHGLDLTEAETSLFFSNDFSYERRFQALRRVWRLGQTKRTRVVDLYAPGTVEEGIMGTLEWKEELPRVIVDKKGLINFIDGILPVRG